MKSKKNELATSFLMEESGLLSATEGSDDVCSDDTGDDRALSRLLMVFKRRVSSSFLSGSNDLVV